MLSKPLSMLQDSSRLAKPMLPIATCDTCGGLLSVGMQADGEKALDELSASLKRFDGVLEAKDKQGVPAAAADALGFVGDIEAAMVQKFPFDVPKEYANLPQLKAGSLAACIRWLCR